MNNALIIFLNHPLGQGAFFLVPNLLLGNQN